MNTVSQDIKDRLVDQNVATFGTDLFIGVMPDQPDACISISDTTGFAPELRYEWERPGCQTLIRGAEGGYYTAYATAREVHTALHGITNLTVNGTIYKLISAVSSPAFIGQDSKNRPMFSINFEVQRTTA